MSDRVSDAALQLIRNEAERQCLFGTVAALDELIERRAKERALTESFYTKLGDHGGGCPEDAT